MNVSKEVKEMLLESYAEIHTSILDLEENLYRLKNNINALTVTEPAAPAKHEWKVGDCFKRGEAIRRICRNLRSSCFFTMQPNGKTSEGAEHASIADLINNYNSFHKTELEPATLDEWFAAVRKAHEASK